MGAVLTLDVKDDGYRNAANALHAAHAPIEVPGVHPAAWGGVPVGNWLLMALNLRSDRQIVENDRSTAYATTPLVPRYLFNATPRVLMTFDERSPGETERRWARFYPGTALDEEFVSPLRPKVASTLVFPAPLVPTLEIATSIKSADAPVREEMKQRPTLAVKPTRAEVQLAEPVTPPARGDRDSCIRKGSNRDKAPSQGEHAADDRTSRPLPEPSPSAQRQIPFEATSVIGANGARDGGRSACDRESSQYWHPR